MKKCKHCQSEIDVKAKVCPNCKKKQGMPTILIIFLVIVGISIISGIASSGDEKENNESTKTTTTEKLTLLEGHSGSVTGSGYTYTITGTIKNNTDKEYDYVSIDFNTYDKDGNTLDTCTAYADNIEPNGSWKFEAECFFDNKNANEVDSYKLKEIDSW